MFLYKKKSKLEHVQKVLSFNTPSSSSSSSNKSKDTKQHRVPNSPSESSEVTYLLFCKRSGITLW